jgi:hypothetical protein
MCLMGMRIWYLFDRDMIAVAAVIVLSLTSSVLCGLALRNHGFSLLRLVGLIAGLAITVFATLLFLAGTTGEL